MPEARLDGCLHWSHLSSGHTGANRSVDFFRQCFYSSLTLTECNVPRLDVNPEIPNPSGGTMQNNSVITADLTNRTFGA